MEIFIMKMSVIHHYLYFHNYFIIHFKFIIFNLRLYFIKDNPIPIN